jgi:transcriptional regulator with XRE-family HTH domain
MVKKYQNLEEYFSCLSKERGAKTQFIKRLAKKTGCTFGSVQNWCLGTARTSNFKYLTAIAEETGIAIDKIFSSDEEC